MTTVLLVISIIYLIISIIAYFRSSERREEDCIINIILSIVMIVLFGVCETFVIGDWLEYNSYNDKIIIYEQSNKAIEEELRPIIDLIKKEKDININAHVIVEATHPLIYKNTIVREKLQQYYDNNEEIKNLKIQQQYYADSKWWLYFG